MSLAAPAPLCAALQVVQSFQLVLSGCQAVVVSCMGPVKSQRGYSGAPGWLHSRRAHGQCLSRERLLLRARSKARPPNCPRLRYLRVDAATQGQCQAAERAKSPEPLI